MFYYMVMTAIVGCNSLESWANAIGLTDEIDSSSNNDIRQLHMLGCLRGFNAFVAIMSLFGIVTESSHYRQILAIGLIIKEIIMTYDAYIVGIEMWYIPATFTIITTISLLLLYSSLIVNNLNPRFSTLFLTSSILFLLFFCKH